MPARARRQSAPALSAAEAASGSRIAFPAIVTRLADMLALLDTGTVKSRQRRLSVALAT